MSDSKSYVIRGGIEGRERLRVLGRVMRDTSVCWLFERVGVRAGLSCVDFGCGGGAALDIARRVAPHGRCSVSTSIEPSSNSRGRKQSSREWRMSSSSSPIAGSGSTS